MQDYINNVSSWWDIHSVKRLSDGEVFNVGDRTFDGVITKFEILDDVLIVFIDNVTWITLHLVKKVKQLLFTTEDGVDIYYGAKVHSVDKNFLISADDNRYIPENFKPKLEYKYFSKREAAEEYILLNNPCLSIKEIAPIFGMFHLDNSKLSLDRLSDKLKDLVKTKI